MNLPDLFHIDAKLNPLAATERTQHAIAGEGAVGLARLTADQAALMEPGFFVLSYIKKMNHFAQKAELTRRILERYLVGTDVDRVEPVFVPATPMSYSAYSFPSQDPSVMKAEHMPYDMDRPFAVRHPSPTFGRPQTLYPQMSGFGDPISSLLLEQRRLRISNFI